MSQPKPKERRKKPGPKKGEGGAPTVLTPEMQADVIEALGYGWSNVKVADLIGIDESTIRAWRKGELPISFKGKERENLSRAIKSAPMRGEMDLLQRVRQGEKGWQGSAWILERTRSEYVKVEKHEFPKDNAREYAILHGLDPEKYAKNLATVWPAEKRKN